MLTFYDFSFLSHKLGRVRRTDGRTDRLKNREWRVLWEGPITIQNNPDCLLPIASPMQAWSLKAYRKKDSCQLSNHCAVAECWLFGSPRRWQVQEAERCGWRPQAGWSGCDIPRSGRCPTPQRRRHMDLDVRSGLVRTPPRRSRHTQI